MWSDLMHRSNALCDRVRRLCGPGYRTCTPRKEIFQRKTVLNLPVPEPYKIVYDDDKTVCIRIRDKAECEKAARLLKLSDQSAGVDDDSEDYPPHCYHYLGKHLYFNTASQPRTKCSRTNPCICKTTSGK